MPSRRDKLFVKLELLKKGEELDRITNFLKNFDYTSIADSTKFCQYAIQFNDSLNVVLKPEVKRFVCDTSSPCVFLLRSVNDLVRELDEKFDSTLYVQFKQFLQNIDFLCRLERRRNILKAIQNDSSYELNDLFASLVTDKFTSKEAMCVRFGKDVSFHTFTHWQSRSRGNFIVSFDLMNAMNLNRQIHGIAMTQRDLRKSTALSFCKLNKNLNVDLSILYDVIEPDFHLPDIKYYILFTYDRYVVCVTEPCYFKLLTNINCFNVKLEYKRTALVNYLYHGKQQDGWQSVWLSVGHTCSRFSHVAVYDWTTCVARAEDSSSVMRVKDLSDESKNDLLYRQLMKKYTK